jgi:hypothetical protein
MVVKHIITVLFGFVFIPLSVNTALYGDEAVIIANNSVPVDIVDQNTISNIYRAEETKWSNGDTIVVVMQKAGPLHEEFVQNIVGLSPVRLRNIWKQVIFTGLGNPPRIFKNEKDLVDFVRDTRGAIGYICASTSHKAVKVIHIK